MGIFGNWFKGTPKPAASSSVEVPSKVEHAVIVRFNYGIQRMDELYELRQKLKLTLDGRDIGDYDGHEMRTDFNDGIIWMYGPNAEALFKAVEPVLRATPFLKGAVATLRFGPPKDGVLEYKVMISDAAGGLPT